MDSLSLSRTGVEAAEIDVRSLSDGDVDGDALSAGPRYTFPRSRVALALALLIGGFCLILAGIALPTLWMGVVGSVIIIPGAYVTVVYACLWRGDTRFKKEDWLERVET